MSVSNPQPSRDAPDMTVPFGVFFSANDHVYDWAIAFLNSLRASNPELPCYLIPFNDDCQQLNALASKYAFEFFEDPSFADLEQLGQDYELGHTAHGRYWFRRYAAFWGPVETFFYLDSRQIVLGELQPYLKSLQESSFDLLHFDTAVNQVYEPGSHRQHLLQERRGRGFNSGRWAAKRGSITHQDFLRLGRESLSIRDQLNPRNTDQGFINYVCDHLPVKYANIAEVHAELAHTTWARQEGKPYRDAEGTWRLWDYGGLDHKRKLLIMHWAGLADQSTMPQRRLFRQFRDLRKQLATRVKNRLVDAASWLPMKCMESLRTNRQLNTFYHGLRSKSGTK